MAEIRQVQRNRQALLRRHAPGPLDLLMRKPLAQLAWPPLETMCHRRSPGVHTGKYTQIPLRRTATDGHLAQARQYRDNSQWPAGAAGNFHGERDHIETRFGKTVQVGKVFKHRHLMGEQRHVCFEHG